MERRLSDLREYVTSLPSQYGPIGGRREGAVTKVLENYLPHVAQSILGLPQRAMEAAGSLQRGGSYDPAPALEAATMTMGATPFKAPAGALGAGPIKAYHGSPYDFERFDMSKIGTGEGAQAYGHGLYFAENPAVAADYRRVLTNQMNLSNAKAGLDREALKYINAHGSVDAAKAAVEAEMKQWAGSPRAIEQLQALRDAIREPNKGRMYEVNIRAEPEQFLDYDKSLMAQPPAIQEVAREIYKPGLGLSPNATGEKLYEALQLTHHQPGRGHLDQAIASNVLRDAGIPGIKYLDQGSRQTAGGELIDVFKGPEGWQSKIRMNRPNGEQYFTTSMPLGSQEAAQQWAQSQIGKQGTSNYVLFRDDIIDILRKYGLAGASVPPLLSQISGAQNGGNVGSGAQ